MTTYVDGGNKKPNVPIYRHRQFQQGRQIRADKYQSPRINKRVKTVDVQRVQKSTVRISCIYGGAEHAGIKGIIYGKIDSLLTRCDPQKLEKPLLKRWPRGEASYLYFYFPP